MQEGIKMAYLETDNEFLNRVYKLVKGEYGALSCSKKVSEQDLERLESLRSQGIIFCLLRSNETASSMPVYIIPEFLPENCYQPSRLNETKSSYSKLEVDIQTRTCSAEIFAQLICAVGEDFSRSAIYWKNGLALQSSNKKEFMEITHNGGFITIQHQGEGLSQRLLQYFYQKLSNVKSMSLIREFRELNGLDENDPTICLDGNQIRFPDGCSQQEFRRTLQELSRTGEIFPLLEPGSARTHNEGVYLIPQFLKTEPVCYNGQSLEIMRELVIKYSEGTTVNKRLEGVSEYEFTRLLCDAGKANGVHGVYWQGGFAAERNNGIGNRTLAEVTYKEGQVTIKCTGDFQASADFSKAIEARLCQIMRLPSPSVTGDATPNKPPQQPEK